jgi:hypothetical protein
VLLAKLLLSIPEVGLGAVEAVPPPAS